MTEQCLNSPLITYKPLEWRELKEGEHSSYNCLISDTSPFGEIRIEWKGWKEDGDGYVVSNQGDHIGVECSLEEAKALAQKWNNENIARSIAKVHANEKFNLSNALSLTASKIHQYARDLPLGDERTEAYQIYQILHQLRRTGAAERILEAINPFANLTDDVEKITNLLSNNEWAEHVANTPLGQRLEGQITGLLNCINGSCDE